MRVFRDLVIVVLFPSSRAAAAGGQAMMLPMQPAIMDARSSAGASPYVFGPSGGSAEAYKAYLRAGHAATPSACSEPGFTDDFRANCLARHDPSKKPELEASLSACMWTKDNSVDFAATHQGPAPVPEHEVPYNANPLAFERCVMVGGQSTAANDSSLGAFHAFRIGPVTTYGGKDWTSFSSSLTAAQVFGIPGGDMTFAMREAFAGAMSADGKLLGYPPLHTHHYHTEEKRESTFDPSSHAIITHGDDFCSNAYGSIECTIRRMAPGYATLIRTPWVLSADFNDVREAKSDGLTWYLLLTLRGAPHTPGTMKPFTEMRVVPAPQDCLGGYFGTYLIPSNQATVFWQESTWWRTATVIHAYCHTHPQWVQEFMLFTGASGSQVGMDSLNVSKHLTIVDRANAEQTKQRLVERAEAAGATLVCRYWRNKNLAEIVNGTSELGDIFWRLSAGCVPFQMTRGTPFFYFTILAPHEAAAAAARGGSIGHPLAPLVGMHTWFRIFVSLEDDGVDTANCDAGCGFGYGLSNDARSMRYACSSLTADAKRQKLSGSLRLWPIDCLPGTEVLSPPMCTRNNTQFLREAAENEARDYAGAPRRYDHGPEPTGKF